MATRSNIGMKVENGYDFIYCHWDGYPSNNGRILLRSYTNPDMVYELINLGDLSSLGDDLQKTVAYSRATDQTTRRFTDNRDEIYQEDWAYVWENGMWWVKGYKVDWQPLTVELCDR